MTRIFTIGFTETTAEMFFQRLFSNNVQTVIDVRLWNRSQLAGFAKVPDLPFFLQKMGGVSYRCEPLLAPTKDLLSSYRSKKINWNDYETSYLKLIRDREVERRLAPEAFSNACLLCSEAQPHQCHRRLALEYLSEKWGKELLVKHL